MFFYVRKTLTFISHVVNLINSHISTCVFKAFTYENMCFLYTGHISTYRKVTFSFLPSIRCFNCSLLSWLSLCRPPGEVTQSSLLLDCLCVCVCVCLKVKGTLTRQVSKSLPCMLGWPALHLYLRKSEGHQSAQGMYQCVRRREDYYHDIIFCFLHFLKLFSWLN